MQWLPVGDIERWSAELALPVCQWICIWLKIDRGYFTKHNLLLPFLIYLLYSDEILRFQNTLYQMRFEVHTAVKMSMLVFWVVTPCELVCRYRRFGETYCRHLQLRRRRYIS
jgi:hypothetical protein